MAIPLEEEQEACRDGDGGGSNSNSEIHDDYGGDTSGGVGVDEGRRGDIYRVSDEEETAASDVRNDQEMMPETIPLVELLDEEVEREESHAHRIDDQEMHDTRRGPAAAAAEKEMDSYAHWNVMKRNEVESEDDDDEDEDEDEGEDDDDDEVEDEDEDFSGHEGVDLVPSSDHYIPTFPDEVYVTMESYVERLLDGVFALPVAREIYWPAEMFDIGEDDYMEEVHEDYYMEGGHEAYYMEEQEPMDYRRPAARGVIESLPSATAVAGDRDATANDGGSDRAGLHCAVCMDAVSVEEIKLLPCSHHYHANCIARWLRLRNTCPLCRYELPAAAADDDEPAP